MCGVFLVGIGLFFYSQYIPFLSPVSETLQSPFFSPSIPFYKPSPVTIDRVFDDDHSLVATVSSERRRVFMATGDVMLGRVVNIQATKKNNFLWAFEKTADFLKAADITFINLEAPLVKDCPLVNEGFKFCGDERHVEGLLFAGIDVASIANNHAGNYGREGIENTIQLLTENNILVTGRNKAVYKDMRGIRFAFLGYNDIGYKEDGIAWTDEKTMKSEISEAKKNADVVVVSVHWGAEYQSQPDKRQIDLAHLLIDAGGDLIIGNHPHWIQPIEIYKNKFITYAHGNFIFDQEWSLETKGGGYRKIHIL